MSHIFDKPIVPKDAEPEVTAEPGPERGTQEWARAKLAEIYSRVDKAGPNTFSSIKFREKLRNDVRELVWNQTGVLTIEKFVIKRIREFELGSIR